MFLLRLSEVFSLARVSARNKIILGGLVASIIINIILWIILFFNFWQSTEYIILGYTVYFGISSLGPWQQVLLLPASGLIVLVINFLIIFHIYLKQRMLSYFFVLSALIFNLIVLLAGSLLIYINF
ncbi:MAG: hypothetical protein WCP18_00475 [bacterium]